MSNTRFETGARVVVAINDFEPWNRFVADTVQGQAGTIVEIKEGYEFPCRGYGVAPGLPGHLVEFDETLLKSDGRPFKAFWFLSCDIRSEAAE